jgi:hypothetical protein
MSQRPNHHQEFSPFSFLLGPQNDGNLPDEENRAIWRFPHPNPSPPESRNSLELIRLREEVIYFGKELAKLNQSIEELKHRYNDLHERYAALARQTNPLTISNGQANWASNPIIAVPQEPQASQITERDKASARANVPRNICRHFLKGTCRHKKECQYSHDLRICPYCDSELPKNKVSASSHLSHCFKISEEKSKSS